MFGHKLAMTRMNLVDGSEWPRPNPVGCSWCCNTSWGKIWVFEVEFKKKPGAGVVIFSVDPNEMKKLWTCESIEVLHTLFWVTLLVTSSYDVVPKQNLVHGTRLKNPLTPSWRRKRQTKWIYHMCTHIYIYIYVCIYLYYVYTYTYYQY